MTQTPSNNDPVSNPVPDLNLGEPAPAAPEVPDLSVTPTTSATDYTEQSAQQAYGQGATEPPAAPQYAQPAPGYSQPAAPQYSQPGGYGQPVPGQVNDPYAQPGVGAPGQLPVAGYGNAPGDLTMASMAHWLGILISFIGPLIIMLTKGEQDGFVKAHAVEALNFNITVVIGYVVLSILSVVTFGIAGLLYIPLWIVALIFQVQGAMAANKGQPYTYPFALRLVK